MTSILLVHPPFADPTQSYLALPSLKGHLRRLGRDARVVDLNIEATHWLLSPDRLEALATRIGIRFHNYNHARSLDFEEQLEYRALAECRVGLERLMAARPSPIEVLQDAELFYDAGAYSVARRHLDALFAALSAAHFPLELGFNQATRRYVPWSFPLLDAHVSPLAAFYDEVLSSPTTWEEWDEGRLAIAPEELDLVGISIVFPSQIPEAFALVRTIKAHAPSAFVVLGGPTIHQAVMHMDEVRRRELLARVDAVALFEGEPMIAQLADAVPAWRAATSDSERAAALAGVPNLLSLDATGSPRVSEAVSFDLGEAVAPDYSDLDLDRYLAPSRILLYAPTRGCYWGRCSFCYYGLTQTGTAAYREVPPERAAADLAQMTRMYGTRHVYLSTDVLSPRYAVRFAEAVLERGLKLRWSTDLKIERTYTAEKVEILARAGLRSVAFGIESGSDRILKAMAKGVDRACMTEVNRLFHDAGIATEWMTFTDHPGERADEALATLEWIARESEHVDLFIVGEFGLQPGSAIAQDPAAFGLRRVELMPGDDLCLYMLHDAPRIPADEQKQIEERLGQVAAPYALGRYPWAGAISTHHTFLHFLRFGQRVFLNHFQKAGAQVHGELPEGEPCHILGMRESARFNLPAIAREERAFTERYLPAALRHDTPGRRAEGEQGTVALSAQAYALALAETRQLSARRGK